VSTGTIAQPGPDDGLIFQWEGRVYSRWRLAVMLLLSLLAHAASFYILQVAYTPTGSLLPPPAQVVLVPPESPESASLARWIDMADPSLMSEPRPLSVAQVLGAVGFHYVPSYATVLQEFKPLPEQGTAEAPPQTRKPGPVPTGLLPALSVPAEIPATSAGRTPAARHTRVVLSGGIEALFAHELPPVPPPGSLSAKPLERTVFLVGVPAGGGRAWVFQEASSGDAAENGADAAARAYLAKLEFNAPARAGTGDVVWGWATFYWGRDAYP
jgi:hypothetical protein